MQSLIVFMHFVEYACNYTCTSARKNTHTLSHTHSLSNTHSHTHSHTPLTHTHTHTHRPVPMDMAGFAINVDRILESKAVMGKTGSGERCRRLETCFLEQFTTRETAECIRGKEVYMIDIICIDGKQQCYVFFRPMNI